MLMVALAALDPQKSMFESSAAKVRLELSQRGFESLSPSHSNLYI